MKKEFISEIAKLWPVRQHSTHAAECWKRHPECAIALLCRILESEQSDPFLADAGKCASFTSGNAVYLDGTVPTNTG